MTDTLDHTRETLWVTDKQMIERMGAPEKVARDAIRELDADPRRSGFPQKQKLWGDRRYWPAVKAWLDARNGLNIDPPPQLRRERHAR